ncbi:hypothetical protein EFA46_007625 [Halarchaeum sp. CBA1220]|uniref:hypothetical protein n=1 Tax=Halarchaeum sp. CBA1220 TaxID=1853682 RepID=UPI000F3A8FC3|nr:hypothetical protein [Halarchaeum sp. CBA1220]QLC34078.1 hypothetical protein EFA46_007625 [Halarchaeum sp. CBA1220]
MTARLRRLAAVALVVLIVSSTAAAPVAGASTVPTGTAAIDSPDGAPSAQSDAWCGVTAAISEVVFGSSSLNCSVSTTQDVKEVASSEDNQTQLDIKNAALAQKASSETFNTVSSNYLNDTQSVAWSKAEIAIANAHANNSSLTTAKHAARDAIADYYSRYQANQIESWNASATSMVMLSKRATNETGVSDDTIFMSTSFPEYDGSLGGYGYRFARSDQTVTLANGTTHGAVGITADGLSQNLTVSANQSGSYRYVGVMPFNESREMVLNGETYHDRWNRTEALAEQLQSEAGNYTERVYSALDNGTIESSQITSRTTKMFELAASSSTDGEVDLYRSVALYASMGLATPSLDGLGTMEVSHDGTTDYGILLAERAPNGTWRANTTYETPPDANTSAIGVEGPVRLATTGGDVVTLSGEFEVGNITNTNGEQIANVSAERRSYQTANVSGLIAKMNETQQLIAQIESRQATGGSGNGSGSSSGGSGPLIIIGLAVVAIGAAAVMQRD